LSVHKDIRKKVARIYKKEIQGVKDPQNGWVTDKHPQGGVDMHCQMSESK